MKRNAKKLLLDLAILLVFVLMMKKNAISLTYHEIAGLALFAAMAVHLVLNRKWIAGVTKKLFAKGTPARTRVCWFLDLLLVLSFCCFTLSGIMISKIVFGINASGAVWKTMHYSAAMDALVLMGIHLGLHAGYIRGVLSKKKPGRAAVAVILLIALAICGFGVYSMASGSFTRYFAMQFQSGSQQWAGEHGGQAFAGGAMPSGAGMPSGGQPGAGGGSSISITTILGTIAGYFSISFLFAAAAFAADSIASARRRKRGCPAAA